MSWGEVWQKPAPKIRLFVDAALGPGAEVMLAPDQAHYLFNVMRAAHGTEVAVFNGRDGEWLGRVTRTGRLGGAVTCRAPGRPQRHPPDLWLVFAPIKKARTDFIVEKAAELGAARVLPVFTRHSNDLAASSPTACAPTPSRPPSSAARPSSSTSPAPSASTPSSTPGTPPGASSSATKRAPPPPPPTALAAAAPRAPGRS